MSFLADYHADRATEADLLRHIQEWAAAPLDSPAAQLHLWDYLGMTLEQYRRWVSKGELPEV